MQDMRINHVIYILQNGSKLNISTNNGMADLSEKSGKLRCLNIMLVLSKVATGLATPLPAMSLPTCRAPCSKIATLSPMLHPVPKAKCHA